MKADYTKMTSADFDDHFDKVMERTSRATILSVPGVAELLHEEFNNAVPKSWARANPKLAYPNAEEEDEAEEDAP